MHNDKSHDHIFATFYVVQFSIRGCDISCVHGWGEGGYVHRSYFSNEYWAGIIHNSATLSSIPHAHAHSKPPKHTHSNTNTHTHTLTALPVPDPPLSVQVTSITTTTASITWSAPPFDPTNLIAFYNLTVGEDTFGLPDIEIMYTGLTYQYTFTGLEEYVNYTCDVISVGVFGTFSAPASTNFTTLEAGKLK